MIRMDERAGVGVGLDRVFPGLPEDGIADEVHFCLQIEAGHGGGATLSGVTIRDMAALIRALRRARNVAIRMRPSALARSYAAGIGSARGVK